MRKEGYYWIKLLKGSNYIMGLYVHACEDPYWIIMGRDCIFTDSMIYEIDEQIIPRKV